ncbi:right-handed parallel beta-helix repeat-containing protein, partial [Nostoc sp. NIES-2111]
IRCAGALLVIAAGSALLSLAFAVPAVAATSAAGGAAGRVYFVSTTGDDGAPGTSEQPWATPEAAAARAKAGDTVLFRGGTYALRAQVRVAASGTPDRWITFASAPGESATLDASAIRQFGADAVPHHRANNGAFQIQGVSHVRVIGLRLVRSQDAGFVIRDSSHVSLINNETDLTFSSGIAVWDSDNRGRATREIRVIGNTIHRATTWDMKPESFPRTKDGQPQEAISIAGAVGFEVAYNQVSHGDKEGIDVKETSRRGRGRRGGPPCGRRLGGAGSGPPPRRSGRPVGGGRPGVG